MCLLKSRLWSLSLSFPWLGLLASCKCQEKRASQAVGRDAWRWPGPGPGHTPQPAAVRQQAPTVRHGPQAGLLQRLPRLSGRRVRGWPPGTSQPRDVSCSHKGVGWHVHSCLSYLNFPQIVFPCSLDTFQAFRDLKWKFFLGYFQGLSASIQQEIRWIR